ncbi:hypothetical protein DM02DRAFT_702941, partial [Periconia macrospinosa]
FSSQNETSCPQRSAVYPARRGVCLVYRDRNTYSLPPVLGIVSSSLILHCLGICVCSITLVALVASLWLLRMARRSL